MEGAEAMDLMIVLLVVSVIVNIVASKKKPKRRQIEVKPKKTSVSTDMDYKDMLSHLPFKEERKPLKTKRSVIKGYDEVKTPEPSGSYFSKKIQAQDDVNHLEHDVNYMFDLNDMQRAIVMSEILGKPKALRR